jgi:hypothetical protein
MNRRLSGRFTLLLAAIALAASQPAAANIATAGDRLPVVLASASPVFDDACSAYYNAGNDPEVMTDYGIPEIFCQCLAERYTNQGLGADALDFFARTYSDDLTTFIDEYPQGEAWMRISADAEVMCKSG